MPLLLPYKLLNKLKNLCGVSFGADIVDGVLNDAFLVDDEGGTNDGEFAVAVFFSEMVHAVLTTNLAFDIGQKADR